MSTVDLHDHLSVEQLSEYAEGLITDPSALATMDAHLAGCMECRQLLRDLRDVPALLQAEPVGPMPAMVAIRLQAALAAAAHERRLDQAGGEHPTSLPTASAGLTPETEVTTPASRSAETEIIAAAQTGSELGEAAVAGEPPSAGRPRSLSDARRRRARTVSALAAAATVAAFAIGAAIFTQGTSGSDDQGSGALAPHEQARDNAAHGYTGPTPTTGGAYLTESGHEFTAYTLSATAQGLLSQRTVAQAATPAAPMQSDGGALGYAPSSPGPESLYPGAADNLSTLLSATGLAACVAQLVADPADVQVLAIDVGTYDGSPAVLLLLSDPADPAKAQVRVVGERCGQGQAAELLRTEIQRS